MSIIVSCREFNKNLVKPRTNTEVEAFKRKKKGKKAGDDAIGMLHVARDLADGLESFCHALGTDVHSECCSTKISCRLHGSLPCQTDLVCYTDSMAPVLNFGQHGRTLSGTSCTCQAALGGPSGCVLNVLPGAVLLPRGWVLGRKTPQSIAAGS